MKKLRNKVIMLGVAWMAASVLVVGVGLSFAAHLLYDKPYSPDTNALIYVLIPFVIAVCALAIAPVYVKYYEVKEEYVAKRKERKDHEL